MKRPRKKYLLRILPEGIREGAKRFFRHWTDIDFVPLSSSRPTDVLREEYQNIHRLLSKGYQVYLLIRIGRICPLQDAIFVRYRLKLSKRQEGQKQRIEYYTDVVF